MALVGQMVFAGTHGDIAMGENAALMRVAAVALHDDGMFDPREMVKGLLERSESLRAVGVEPTFAHMLTMALWEHGSGEIGIWLHDTDASLTELTVVSAYDLIEPADPEFFLVDAVQSVLDGADVEEARRHLRERVEANFEVFRGSDLFKGVPGHRYFSDVVNEDLEFTPSAPLFEINPALFARDFDTGVVDVCEQLERSFSAAMDRIPQPVPELGPFS